LDKVISGETSLPPDRTVRLHIIRNTDYGDRYKLFRLRSPNSGDSRHLSKVWGMELAKEDDGRYGVVNLGFMGEAEKAKVAFGDYVTNIDVEQIDRPPKELVYPVALLFLAFVIISQRRRSRLGRGL
jgi:hypothetical protein